MNYTENYHLPQWKKDDRIMMDDFNQMCLDMEAGLKKTAQDAASATAQSSADAAQAAQKAQATADKAVADAAKAQSKADAAYAPDQPPYTIGSYTGSHTINSLTVDVGFRPSFLILGGADNPNFQIVAGPDSDASGHLDFTDTGFIVKKRFTAADMGGTEMIPMLLYPGTHYQYIAFR